MYYRAALILLCLFIAPGAVAQPAAPKKPDGRKTIGVISAIGEKFTVQKDGVMVFGNDLKETPVQSWGIDDLVARSAPSSASNTTSSALPLPKERST